MNSCLICLLAALALTGQRAPAGKPAVKSPGIGSSVSDAKDPVEKEYAKLLEDDDAAQEEVDKWIRDEEAFKAAGAGISKAVMSARIDKRFDTVRQAYKDFLRRHPKHARARLAYGSFLDDIGEEEEAGIEWEQAKKMDPQNPAVWNNLANHYGHRGPIEKAFQCYEKAIELNPNESTYVWNLATTTYLFRRGAMLY